MACSPAALCCIQRKVQRVLADYTDRSHGHFHTRTSVMTVEEHKIRGHFVSCDNVLLRQPCQHPDLSAALQGTGSFISDTFTQQVIGELKCFFVLHNAVAVGYHTQNSIISAADIGTIAGDHSTRAGIDITAFHLPIQTGQFQGFTACRGIHDDTAKAVPRGLTDREHRFNICGHSKISFSVYCDQLLFSISSAMRTRTSTRTVPTSLTISDQKFIMLSPFCAAAL